METFIVKKVSIVFQVSIAIFTESITFVFVVKNIRPLTGKKTDSSYCIKGCSKIPVLFSDEKEIGFKNI